MNSTVIGIIGIGYVGYHLFTEFSKKFETHGFDISLERLSLLNDPHITNDFSRLQFCDLVCICVPTPLTSSKTVNDQPIRNVIETIQQYARHHQNVLIVVESSVSIGMTRSLFSSLREKGFLIGMSPERADPGRVYPEFHKIPKIVSGIDRESLTRLIECYKKIFEVVVPVSSLETAEMCKLYENCFRLVNIAYVNEISDACEKHGINAFEMIKASETKPYGFMRFNPGLGVGGYCIPYNSHYLMSNCELPLLKTASEYTEQRPIRKGEDIIEKYPLAQSFLIIGIAFKYGQSVSENSPGLKLARVLREKERTVHVLDTHVVQNEFPLYDDSFEYDVVVSVIPNNYNDIYNNCVEKNIPYISFHDV